MAIAATTVWEVRTTGSDSNGGGFDSALGGVDYSQQDAPQATGTVTSSGPIVTATAAIFTSQMIGNLITDGTSWFEITIFTSSTVVVVDGSPSWTGASVNVGGALASPGKAAGILVDGNTVWIGGGTYTITTSTPNVSNGPLQPAHDGGSFTTALTWRGYGSTRGDGGRPTIKAAVGSITMVKTGNVGYQTVVRDLILDGDNQSSVIGLHLAVFYGYAQNVWVKNCNGVGIYVNGGNNPSIVGCEVSGNSLTAAYYIASACYVLGCSAHDNTVCGVVVVTLGVVFRNCLSYNNSGGSSDGFQQQDNQEDVLFNCVAYNNGRHGFSYSGVAAGRGTQYQNCISVFNGGYGYYGSTAAVLPFMNNAGYYNTSGNYDTSIFTPGVVVNFQSLTGDPFTNAGAGDFSLNNTAGAGAACRGAGYPEYLDIGAVQHQDSGGAAGMLFVPGMEGM